jgi:hypothetical protein
MSRHALLTFAFVLGSGIVALTTLALVSERSQAFTLGVGADGAVARLRPGDAVCQRPIEAIESFDRVRIQLGTYRRPGTPYTLSVSSTDTRQQLARAMVSGGYADGAVQSVALSREVPRGREVAVCIRNTARQPVAVYGSSDLSNRSSTSYLNGRATGADLMVVFEFPGSKSTLELLPAIVRRAALFHGGWASTGVYWVLFALLFGALATLPAVALRSALVRAPDRE